MNDIDWKPMTLFERALRGEYLAYKHFVTSDEFKETKETDPFVTYCWSFGNKGTSYMYAANTEAYKHAAHEFIVNNDFSLLEALGYEKAKYVDDYSHNRKAIAEHYFKTQGVGKEYDIKSFVDLTHLTRLNRVNSISNVNKKVAISVGGYDEFKLPDDCVVYCDIPYENTAEYVAGGFNHKRFYDWAYELALPIFISSYNISDPRFKCVKEFKVTGKLSQNNYSNVVERVFIPDKNEFKQVKQLTLF